MAPSQPGSQTVQPAIPPAASPNMAGAGSFTAARSNFTKYTQTRSGSSLRGALSSYVRTGTGGARRAARRMSASRSVGGKLLGVIRDFQQAGPNAALRQFNLSGLSNQPATNVFITVMEFICPPGGTIDDAIARQAMLESIGGLADAGVQNFDTMTPDQLKEFFLDFISRSIEARVINDIASRGITLPDDVAGIEIVQQQLHDFVHGCARGALSGRLDNINGLNDAQMQAVVTDIYEASFEIIAATAEGLV